MKNSIIKFITILYSFLACSLSLSSSPSAKEKHAATMAAITQSNARILAQKTGATSSYALLPREQASDISHSAATLMSMLMPKSDKKKESNEKKRETVKKLDAQNKQLPLYLIDETDIIQKLKAGKPVAQVHESLSLLIWASNNKNKELVSLLLNDPQHKKTLNKPDKQFFCTPLAYAAINGSVDVAHMLLNAATPEQYESMINYKDLEGMTPFMRATLNGQLSIMQLLYDKAPNKNKIISTTNIYGQNALTIAAEGVSIPIVSFLLEREADSIAAALEIAKLQKKLFFSFRQANPELSASELIHANNAITQMLQNALAEKNSKILEQEEIIRLTKQLHTKNKAEAKATALACKLQQNEQKSLAIKKISAIREKIHLKQSLETLQNHALHEKELEIIQAQAHAEEQRTEQLEQEKERKVLVQEAKLAKREKARAYRQKRHQQKINITQATVKYDQGPSLKEPFLTMDPNGLNLLIDKWIMEETTHNRLINYLQSIKNK